MVPQRFVAVLYSPVAFESVPQAAWAVRFFVPQRFVAVLYSPVAFESVPQAVGAVRFFVPQRFVAVLYSPAAIESVVLGLVLQRLVAVSCSLVVAE